MFSKTHKQAIAKVLSVIVLMVLSPKQASSQCTATSVQVCGVADDFETIYINGVMVGSGFDFRFVHVQCPGTMDPWSECPTPVCVTTTNASILNSITTLQTATVAAQVVNAKNNDVWGSWYVDITCSSGQHSYIASNAVSTEMFTTGGSGGAGTTDP